MKKNEAIEIDFNELPEGVSTEEIEPGIYILKIEDIILENNEDFGTQYQFSHSIPGYPQKINYDNYRIFDAEGNPHDWGRGKLRAMIEASQTKMEKINLVMLQNLLKGEYIKAELELNKKKYPQIKFANLYPLDYEEPAINQEAYEAEVKNKSTKKEKKEETPSEDIAEQFDDSDI